MKLNRIGASALAAIIGVSGVGAILSTQAPPAPVEGVELQGDMDDGQGPLLPEQSEPAIVRPDDDDVPLDAIDDDDPDPTGPSGDGDATQGNDGTSGGNNTADNSGDDDSADAASASGDDTDD